MNSRLFDDDGDPSVALDRFQREIGNRVRDFIGVYPDATAMELRAVDQVLSHTIAAELIHARLEARYRQEGIDVAQEGNS